MVTRLTASIVACMYMAPKKAQSPKTNLYQRNTPTECLSCVCCFVIEVVLHQRIFFAFSKPMFVCSSFLFCFFLSSRSRSLLDVFFLSFLSLSLSLSLSFRITSEELLVHVQECLPENRETEKGVNVEKIGLIKKRQKCLCRGNRVKCTAKY